MRVRRIELRYLAWEASVLPLNYTRGIAWETLYSEIKGVCQGLFVHLTAQQNTANYYLSQPRSCQEYSKLLKKLIISTKKPA